MYTKKRGRKKSRKNNKRTKKYTVKRYTVKRYTVKKNIKYGGTPTPPRVWSQVPREHQSLCVKKYPEDLRKLGNECYKYGDKLWIRAQYDMNDVTDELAPLHIFNETTPNNYNDIQDGIHNFMLFWDDVAQKYTLVTSYFNAFEFGSKHNIISLRSLDQTPNTFIISGEIKKRGNSIHFHDTSSQYFRQECNLKRRAPVIYLYDLINKHNIEIDEDGDVSEDNLDFLKRTILKNNTFKYDFNVKLREVDSLPELKALLLEFFPIGKLEESDIFRDYISLIQTILTDAFKLIFKKDNILVNFVTFFTAEEYNEYDQKNVRKMTDILCPALPFDVYKTQVACKAEREIDKKPFNSCNIPEDESIPSNSSPKGPTAKRAKKN
jgi:hypothetical protein